MAWGHEAVRSRIVGALAAAAWVTGPGVAAATTWYVAPGGSGPGTSAAPFGTVQRALDTAQPGDVIVVRPGRYPATLRSVRSGAPDRPITLRAERPRTVELHANGGTVLRVDHADLVIEGFVIDGGYAPFDAVIAGDGADRLLLRDLEVRRAGRDCIDLRAPREVRIEASLVHHCLAWISGRRDAHGVAAGAVRGLTIRDTEIHTFSGDGVQVDAGRSPDGWDEVLLERCRIWLGPLPEAENGFAAGSVPGENAVDTKVHEDAPRARMTVRDTEAWGFRLGSIDNMAAFNLKEKVHATLDRVSVWDSEIAFRVRGPGGRAGAYVDIRNAVVYEVGTAIRYEDDIEQLAVWNSTFGVGVVRTFRGVSARSARVSVRNLAVLGADLPPEAPPGFNLAVPSRAFRNVHAHDYRPAADAALIDAGERIDEVTTDRDGTPRPQGGGFDIGAYEHPGPAGPDGHGPHRRR